MRLVSIPQPPESGHFGSDKVRRFFDLVDRWLPSFPISAPQLTEGIVKSLSNLLKFFGTLFGQCTVDFLFIYL